MHSGIEAVLVLAALAAGCTDQPAGAADGADRDKETRKMAQATNGGEGVSGLPSSFGRSFATLDEYLEHLRRYAGPIDQPWYREVRPGVYEYVASMRPSPAPQTYTRAELIRKYGFTR